MKLLFENWRQYLNEANFIQSILDKEPSPFSGPTVNSTEYQYAVMYEFESKGKPIDKGGTGKSERYQVHFTVDIDRKAWTIQFNTIDRKQGSDQQMRDIPSSELTHGMDFAVISTIVHIIHDFVFSEERKGPPAGSSEKIRGLHVSDVRSFISKIRTFKFYGMPRNKESEKQGKQKKEREAECKEEYGSHDTFVDDCTRSPRKYFDRGESSWVHQSSSPFGDPEEEEYEQNRVKCVNLYHDKIDYCLEDSLISDPLRLNARTTLYIKLLKAKLPGVKPVIDPASPNDVSFTLPHGLGQAREEELPGQLEEAASEYVYGVKNPGRVANIYRIKVVKK
jgi:hypothetical protein